MIDHVDADYVPKKKKLWAKVKHTYYRWYPYDLRPHTMWYNFKCWAWHRYSTVKSPHLPHTWCDRRELLLYTSFEILTDFIDGECSPGHVQWYGEGAHQVIVNGVMENVMDEMKELYFWWNTVYLKEYPAKMDELWDAVHPVAPDMLCVEFEGMSPHTAGKLEMVHESDETKAAYKALTNEIYETEQLMDEKAEEMLKRLAAVRLWMWT